MSDSTSSLKIQIGSSGDFAAFVRGEKHIADLTRAAETAKNVLSSAFGVGLGFEGIKLLIKNSLDLGSHINDMAGRIEISAHALQVLGQAAQKAGLESDDMVAILGKLRAGLSDAATKGGAAAESFKKLGLDAKTLSDAPLEKVLEAIGFQIVNAKDKTVAYAAAVDILGSKNVPKLNEMLKRLGVEGFGALAKEAITLSDKQVENLDKASKAWERIGLNIKLAIAATVSKGIDKKDEKFMSLDFAGKVATSPFKAIGGFYEWFWSGKGGDKTPPIFARVSEGLMGHNLLVDQSADAIRKAAEVENDWALAAARRNLIEEQIRNGNRIYIDDLKATGEAQRKQADAWNSTVESAKLLADPLNEYRDKIKEIEEANTKKPFEEAAAALAALRQKMDEKGVDDFFAAQDARSSTMGRHRTQNVSSYQQSEAAYAASQSTDTSVNSNFMTMAEGAKAALMDYAVQVGSVGQQIKSTFAGIMQGIHGGLTSGIMGLINHTMTWGQALRNIGNTILTTIIDAIVQMGLKWVAQQILVHVMGKTLAAASVAANLPIAAAQSAVWATPATLATIASFGGAAAAAPAEMAAAVATSMGFAAFADGGLVGGGKQLAWLNDGDGAEYVFSAPAVRNIGAEKLDQFHRSAVSGASSPASVSQSSGPSQSGALSFYTFSNPVEALKAALMNSEGRAVIVDITRGVMREVHA